MLIEQPTWLLSRLLPEAAFRVPSEGGRRCVYLTFDDGPVPGVTERVLDVLDEYGVKGNFFMVGDNVRKHPWLYEEVLRRGHRAGNHTMHHLCQWRVSRRRFLDDVEECSGYVERGLFRPPHGFMDRGMARRLIGMGYRIVMFDVVTRDYSRRLSVRDVVENVKRYVRDGSVVVFHDSERTAGKVEEALRGSIEWLKAEGYEFRLLP